MSSSNSSPVHDTKHAWSLTLAALGVVFGDIATSPLYSLKECFSELHGIAPVPMNILGIISLIIWTLVLLVFVKYITFILRADNNGEGGILALLALNMNKQKKKQNFWLLAIGLFGAALLYGDGAITPAISVISAIEGITLIAPHFEPFVIPVTVSILVCIFSAQRFGTQKIGIFFGPIVFLYLTTIAALGVPHIIENPNILRAFNPYYAIEFFKNNGMGAFLTLSSIFLVATGCEAIYADMGHFGRQPIKRAWLYLVFPCLLLTYLGQGALLLTNPAAANNPFFNLAPNWAMVPLLIIATLATIVASQALISGVFSLTSQSILMGFWPRTQIVHTSSVERGQIYLPQINWMLMTATIFLVLEFRSSGSLAHAYGLGVSLTMFLNTLLFGYLLIKKWGWPKYYAYSLVGLFIVIDGLFLAANSTKFLTGGWFPVAIALTIYTVMTTWKRGRRILAVRMREKTIAMEEFMKEFVKNPNIHRIPGCAVFMSSDTERVPIPLIRNTEINKTLYERILFLSILTSKNSRVPSKDKIQVVDLGEGFFRVAAWYGFMENPSIQSVFEEMAEYTDLKMSMDNCIFFLGRETLIASNRFGGMANWRERLFSFLSRNSQRATQFYSLPPEQVIEIGTQVEL